MPTQFTAVSPIAELQSEHQFFHTYNTTLMLEALHVKPHYRSVWQTRLGSQSTGHCRQRHAVTKGPNARCQGAKDAAFIDPYHPGSFSLTTRLPSGRFIRTKFLPDARNCKSFSSVASIQADLKGRFAVTSEESSEHEDAASASLRSSAPGFFGRL